MNLKIVIGGVLAVVVIVSVYLAMAGTASIFADDSSPVWYFYRDDCHFCQQQKPILEDLASEGYRVKLMDVGRNTVLWKQFQVSGTPTFIADNGKGERITGLTQKEALRAYLDRNGAKVAVSK